MNDSISHTAYIGTTRKGKSETCLRINVPRIGRRDSPSYVIIDPPGTMTKKFAIHAERKGILHQLIYDTLGETSNTPGYEFLTPSDNPDLEQCEAENRERISEAIAIILRSEGRMNAETNPLIHEGLTAALNLFVYQKTRVPFYWLKDCFDFTSDAYRYLIANCTSQEWVRKFERYASLPKKDQDYECGPARRRLEKICGSPQFRKRCVPTFDDAAFLNAGGMLMLDGESKGNLSRPDMSLLMGMVILRVIQLARSGKLKRRVVLIIDEAANAALIDGNLTRALAECAKWNLEIQLIIQNPLGFPPEIQDGIFQNIDRCFIFKQVNHAAVMFCANKIAVPNLQPLKVRFVQTRYRSIENGTIEIPIESTTVTKGPDGAERVGRTTSVQIRPVREEIAEAQDVHWGLTDQVLLKATNITNLGPGECFIMDGNYVSEEKTYIPLLEDPWTGSTGKPLQFTRTQTLAARKLEMALQQMRERPEFQSPVLQSPPCQPKKARGAAARLKNGGNDES